jgi:hypothetical protein
VTTPRGFSLTISASAVNAYRRNQPRNAAERRLRLTQAKPAHRLEAPANCC